MRLELNRKAQADLDAVRDYSAERFGTLRAIAYLDAIEQAFRRILTFPAIGAPHRTIEPLVRSLGCEQHRIFYSVTSETATIVRILHAAMDVERHL